MKRTIKNKILYSDYTKQNDLSFLSDIGLNIKEQAQSVIDSLKLKEGKWFDLNIKLDYKHDAIHYISNVKIKEHIINFIDNTWTEYFTIVVEYDKVISNGITLEEKGNYVLKHKDIESIKHIKDSVINKILFNTILSIKDRILKLESNFEKLYKNIEDSDKRMDYQRRESSIKSKLYALEQSGKHQTWGSFDCDGIEIGIYKKSEEFRRLENDLKNLK